MAGRHAFQHLMQKKCINEWSLHTKYIYQGFLNQQRRSLGSVTRARGTEAKPTNARTVSSAAMVREAMDSFFYHPRYGNVCKCSVLNRAACCVLCNTSQGTNLYCHKGNCVEYVVDFSHALLLHRSPSHLTLHCVVVWVGIHDTA
jgi:hypothetical protein